MFRALKSRFFYHSHFNPFQNYHGAHADESWRQQQPHNGAGGGGGGYHAEHGEFAMQWTGISNRFV